MLPDQTAPELARPELARPELARPELARAVAFVLGEDRAVRPRHLDPALEALALAVLLEEVFGVTLAPADLDARVLGHPARAAAALTRALAPALDPALEVR